MATLPFYDVNERCDLERLSMRAFITLMAVMFSGTAYAGAGGGGGSGVLIQVPEPASLALVAAGIGGILMMRRNRRK